MADTRTPLQAEREQTIDALCREFARDTLTMPELERRLARAREARSRDDLRGLLADLTPVAQAPLPVPADATRTRPAPRTAPRPEPEVRPGSHLAFAVMGGTRRAGKWSPPGSMLSIAIMGGVELDFREAVLTPGVTEINVFAFWGGIEIIVPPNVRVETRGMAIMGGFEESSEEPSDPGPDAPVIRVSGVAIMAGVDIQVRNPGEEPKGAKGRKGGREVRRK